MYRYIGYIFVASDRTIYVTQIINFLIQFQFIAFHLFQTSPLKSNLLMIHNCCRNLEFLFFQRALMLQKLSPLLADECHSCEQRRYISQAERLFHYQDAFGYRYPFRIFLR